MTSIDKLLFMVSRYGVGDGHCKGCMHLKHYWRGNTSCYKCEIYGTSHSVATDWKASNPACGKFNAPCEEIDVYKTIRHCVEHTDIDGQLELFSGKGGEKK